MRVSKMRLPSNRARYLAVACIFPYTCVEEARYVWRATDRVKPGCAMNYDRWAGELAAPLKSRLIYYYVLLLLFGYLYPYNIMPREIPGSRRYVTASRFPGDRDLIFRIGHNLESSRISSFLTPSYLVERSFRFVLSYVRCVDCVEPR